MQPAIYNNNSSDNRYIDQRFGYERPPPSPTNRHRPTPHNNRLGQPLPLLFCDDQGASIEYNYARDPQLVPPPPWENNFDNASSSAVGNDQWRTSNNSSRLSLTQPPPPPTGLGPSTSTERIRAPRWQTNYLGPSDSPYFWSDIDNSNNNNDRRAYPSNTNYSNVHTIPASRPNTQQDTIPPRSSYRNTYGGGGSSGSEQSPRQKRNINYDNGKGGSRQSFATDEMVSLDDIIQRSLDTKNLPRSTLENILIVQYAHELNDFDIVELVPQVKRLVDKRKKELRDEEDRQRLLEQEQEQLLLEEERQKQQKKKQQEDEDSRQCTLCFDKPKDCIFLECGHIASCMECAEKQNSINQKCPVCRQRITRIKHIYYS